MFRRTFVLISLCILCFTPGFASQIDMLLPGISQLSSPLSYGKVYSYAAGTNSAKALYADAALTEPHDNPASLDLNGRLVAYGSGAYKFIIKDMEGNTIITVDNYQLPFTGEVAATNPFGLVLTQAEIFSDYINVDVMEVASLTVTDSLAVSSAQISATGFSALGNRVEAVATGTAVDDATNKGQMDFAISAAIDAISIPSSINVEVFNATGSDVFVVPVGVERIYALILGGGGGGGGGGDEGTYLGVGGGAAYGPWSTLSGSAATFSVPMGWFTPINVTPGETLGLVIGAGGAGGTTGGAAASGTAGLPGEASVITRVLTEIARSDGGLGGLGGGAAAHQTSIPEYTLRGQSSPFGNSEIFPSADTKSGPGAGGMGGGTFSFTIGDTATEDGQSGGDGLILIIY